MPQYPAVIALSSLNGANGFQVNGEAERDYSGVAVSAGDVNGDGVADLIIGANRADVNGLFAGATYVVFGTRSGFSADVALSTLNGSNGFQINAEAAYDLAGNAVASGGDVNGDGFDDVIIGAFGADPNGSSSGASYVVFGKAGGFPATLALSSLTGANGFQLSGEAANDYSGYSVSSAGDVNGDGFDDMLIGAHGADPNGPQSGAAYVVFGKAGGFGATLNLSALDGSNGFLISGTTSEGAAGYSVAQAGDVNGDGFDDIVIGTGHYYADYGEYVGAAYVVFGKAGGFTANLDINNLVGSNGFKVVGATAGEFTIRVVGPAGDLNGDGFDEVLISEDEEGLCYVLYGKPGGFDALVDLTDLDRSDGFKLIVGSPVTFDRAALSGGSDLNGDGFDDLIIGSPNAGNGVGSTFVVFGKPGGFGAGLDLADLNGENGFRVDGESNQSSGASTAAGDVNGDGRADLIIGADRTSVTAPQAGAVYVVYGRDPDRSVVRVGSAIDQAIFGGAFDDQLSGVDGADTLRASGGDDTLLGGAGADQLLGEDGADLLSGGSGDDEGAGGVGDDTLGGGSGKDALSGDAGDDLVQGGDSDDKLSGGAGSDQLFGGSGADLLDGGADDDLFDGGSERDTVTYAAASRGVKVDLGLSGFQDTRGAGLDSFFSIERVIGSRFSDTLSGGAFNDALLGGDRADTLSGGDGTDTLSGGKGDDFLNGGSGADRFVFGSAGESKPGDPDRISGLEGIDVIDLSGVDANTLIGGNQAFVLAAGFTGVAGQLIRVFDSGANRTLFQGDTNGDGAADLAIVALGGDFSGFAGFVL
jgi:hypothetical protein